MRKFESVSATHAKLSLRPEPFEGLRHTHHAPRASHEALTNEQREKLRKQAIVLRLIEYFSR